MKALLQNNESNDFFYRNASVLYYKNNAINVVQDKHIQI